MQSTSRTILPFAVVLGVSPAFAQPARPLPHRARLTYTAPKACPGEQVLRDLVAGQTSSNVLPSDASARLTVVLSRLGAQYQATAELREPAGRLLWTRPFDAVSSCSGLVQEVALVISATLDPRVHVEPAAPHVIVESEKASADEARAQVVPLVPVDPVLFRIGLGSVLAFGAAPRVAVGLAADAGILWPVAWGPVKGVSLAVGGRWDPPAAGHIPWAAADARISTSRLLATVAPCAHWWKLYGCALGELGQVAHHAEGIAVPGGHGDVFAAVGGRAGLEARFAPHLGVRGSGEVLGTLTPVTVLIDARPAWTTPRVSGGVGAALFVFF